ncbi:S24 family peptidase [Elizabethkingia anophelis]|uniref:S24 family peptidase n=1 Tax=Elizabethkingia anophelis TaxID=1117645 RepID=UPI00320925FF
MSSTVNRIKQFIDLKGISVRKFEESVGFSNGSFASQYKNNKTIGVDKVENILHFYPELNPEWLLTGRGEMIKTKSSENLIKRIDNINDKENDKKQKVKKNLSLLVESRQGIPLIPIDAMAGFGTGETQIMEYDTGRYIVPEFTELNVDFMIQVKGSSMYPKYSSGDLVACKKLYLSDIFFQWNKVYVLDTDQGALIKRIRKGNDMEHILLVSENQSYDPFELHMSKIYAVALVVGVIRLE